MSLSYLKNAPGAQACGECGGLGLVRTGPNSSRPCACQIQAAVAGRINRADFPAAFAGATLETYERTESNRTAFFAARLYGDQFIPGHTSKGLLFTGPVGTGKTHLAVAIARWLISTRGITARFVQVGDLLEKLRASYADDGGDLRRQIWRPILAADLVILDELGAARVTDFAFDTQEQLIGNLYNSMTPVIVTTNLANLGAGLSDSANSYARAARPDTLGDRIGSRMFSRLQQMCAEVKVDGQDWRSKRK